MNSTSDDDRSLLDEVAHQEEQVWAGGKQAVEEAEAIAAERRKDTYPETKVTPIEPAPEPEKPEAPDEFALPSETQTRTEAAGDSDRMTVEEMKEQGRDPYESHPPQRIQMAELQKAMLRAKIIVGHTFESDRTPGGQPILEILKIEKPDMYADIVVRCGMALYIGWQKGMGL
jgi:hypothetical protein